MTKDRSIDRRTLLRLGAGAAFAPLIFSAASMAQSPDGVRIGVVGSGRLGGTVGGLWVKAGHHVLFSSRHPEELKDLVGGLGANARAGSVAEAVAFGDVMLIAVPYAALPEVGRDNAAGLKGKVVLDACNPIAARDGDIVNEAMANGVGETSAKYLPGTRLVRAFNSFGAASFASEAHRAGEPIGVPIAGDDPEALKVAAKLVRDAGFEPVAVPLARAKEFSPPAPLFRQALPVSELKAQLGIKGMSEPATAGQPGGFLYSWLARLIDVRREEVAALAWAWLYIFAVLSAYYIMRPIRDQMGVAGGVNNLQWLFTGTLIGMLCLNVPYSYLVKTLPRTRFIPISYRFFAANILVFAALLYFADSEQTIWVGRAFFIWISIFNLFVVSVFWALIVDIFSSEQGKRLFGFIAAGATIGAIAGSGLTALLARTVPVTFLLIGSVLLLEVAVFATHRLSRLAGSMHADPASATDQPVGGNVLAGITHPFKSSYLVNVSVFILLFGITATFLYFQQARIVSQNFADRGAQTAFFATIDLLVNCLTLAVEIFLTGRILRYFGVGLALAFLPLLTLCGFATLAFVPALSALVAFQVLRRSSDYAIARPAREVLYTVLPREDRYKAKNFIDTVVYRAGDQVGAWSYALLAALGLGATEVAATAVVLSIAWLINGLWLGRKQESLAAAMRAKIQAV